MSAFHVLGNVGLDLSMGPVPRLPTWGTEILAGASVYRPGGAAANVALTLAGLGRRGRGLTLHELEGDRERDHGACSGNPAPAPDPPVRLFAAVGADRTGRELRRVLWRAGVDVGGMELLPGETTSLGLALVRADGERAFVTDLGALRRMDEAWALASTRSVRGPGWFLVTGASLLPGLPPQAVGRLLAAMRARGLRTALDMGWDVDDWPSRRVDAWRATLAAVDLFLPNDAEAAALTGGAGPAEAAALLQRLSGGTVVVKTGPGGAWLATPHGTVHVPTRALPVTDTTGAGDCFAAGMIYALAAGCDPVAAVRVGHAVAGAVLQARRARFPSADEVSELCG